LIDKGLAYYCFCTSERLTQLRNEQQKNKLPTMYDGHCKQIPKEKALARSKNEPYVIRLNVPDSGETVFSDMIRGKIKFENKLIDDQVLLKSDGYPTYHLGVVVDDHLMEISHVIRGEEWISSTPKHVILYWAFGWTLPYFAHLPLLRNPDKSKLSKRKNPVWTSWYREQGFLPEAILNYLGTMTWSMPDGRDIFSIEEMIDAFDIKHIKTTAPVFNLEKLNWFNGEYIRALSAQKLRTRLTEFIPEGTPAQLITKLIPLAKTRMQKLTDFKKYLKPFTQYQKPVLESKYQSYIAEFLPLLMELSDWKTAEIEKVAKAHVAHKKLSMREAFMALRLAITGEKIGLPLFETCEIIGKKEVLVRLTQLR
jgi:glutamyl-tRNA synthetase